MIDLLDLLLSAYVVMLIIRTKKLELKVNELENVVSDITENIEELYKAHDDENRYL